MSDLDYASFIETIRELTALNTQQAAELATLRAEHERLSNYGGPSGPPNLRAEREQKENQCHSGNAASVADYAGISLHAAQSVSRAEATASEWLSSQRVKDGREPMLDEGDCRLCGSDGNGHKPTDPCGIVSGLLRELATLRAKRDRLVQSLRDKGYSETYISQTRAGAFETAEPEPQERTPC